MSEKERHKRYTIEFKLAVVDWIKHHKSSYRAAAKQFGVDRKMIREWSANKDVYEVAMNKHGSQRCRVQGGRPPLSSELDLIVLEYLKQERSKGNKVLDRDLQANAVEASKLLNISFFKGTPQWLRRWKKRNNVVVKDGTNVHDPTSLYKPEESLPGKSKGDSLLSHIEPKEQVRLEKKTGSKKNKKVCEEARPSSNHKAIIESSSDGKKKPLSPSPLDMVAKDNHLSSEEEGGPLSPDDVVFDFSAPEHSYCQSDCLVEEEMIGQIPLLDDFEGNDILQLITADGVVEKVASYKDEDRGSDFSRLQEDSTSLLLSEEGLSLGQEVVVSSSGNQDLVNIVKSFRNSREQHTQHEPMSRERSSMHLAKNTQSPSLSMYSPPPTACRITEHSYSQPRYLFSDCCDNSARTMGSAAIQRHSNNMQSFTSSMQGYTNIDHDYEFTSFDRLSPQLPSLPLLPSLPPTFSHQSGFLQELSDFPPVMGDPMNIINSSCGGLFGPDRNLYSSNSGSVAPIVYVDRPTSPPCAVSTQYR